VALDSSQIDRLPPAPSRRRALQRSAARAWQRPERAWPTTAGEDLRL